MKRFKKITALSLAVFMAVNSSIPAFAAEDASSKEEVVYVMTQADGTVDSINVVNIFAGGDVTDYGDYSAVKMLTTTDAINQAGDKITFSSSAEKVYYQGTLQEKEIPWNISIRYFLDKEEYTAEEIAGKSCSLEMKLSITKNSKCKGNFYDEYALQATVLFDTDRCDNIQSNGATVANVGADKQLSYTVLPGKGLETSIYADVTDFEMSAVSINGIKLNMNIEIDDEELKEKVEELMDATEQLDNGASELYDGTEDLKTGSSSLDAGITSLKTGVSELDSGITTLQSGMQSMQTGLNTLNSKSSTLTKSSSEIQTALTTIQKNLSAVSISTDEIKQLTSASGKIKSGIDSLANGVTNLKNNLGYAQYKAVMADSAAMDGMETYLNSVAAGVNDLYSGVTSLQKEYAKFDTAISELTATLSGMATKMTELKTGIDTLVKNYKKFDKGLTEYTDGVADIVSGYNEMINGISSLATGSKKLLKGSDELSDGSSELYDGIVSLCDGAKELNEGTDTLNSETSNMDTEIEDEIDEILASIGGDETETKSFVSDKNTNVDNVQFVIKTSAVEKEEIEVEEKEETESTSFWQKFKQLFGF